MLRDLAMRNAKGIDGHHRFGSPSEITAVNGHVVAVRHHETWFIFEITRKVSQERLDRSSTVGNLWVVLPIVIAKQAVENGRVTIDKNPRNSRQNQRLVGVGSIVVVVMVVAFFVLGRNSIMASVTRQLRPFAR